MENLFQPADLKNVNGRGKWYGYMRVEDGKLTLKLDNETCSEQWVAVALDRDDVEAVLEEMKRQEQLTKAYQRGVLSEEEYDAALAGPAE